VIFKTTYQCEFKKYKLQDSSLLKEFMIDVSHGDNKAQLPLVVLDKDGPSLVGRNWLACFYLDWNVIHNVQHSNVSNVLNKYKSVFAPGLVTLEGFEATIHIDPKVSP